RDRQREHFMLSEDDVRDAIAVEHRTLLRACRLPFAYVDPHQSEEYWAWVTEKRLEARRRVLEFLHLGSLIGSGYAR
ncbi:MAG: hypothetical protein IT329_05385, partial [Caldilineaceae bacterium]|nr:hypothetical protein [Caldilineaceae bacterium]